MRKKIDSYEMSRQAAEPFYDMYQAPLLSGVENKNYDGHKAACACSNCNGLRGLGGLGGLGAPEDTTTKPLIGGMGVFLMMGVGMFILSRMLKS